MSTKSLRVISIIGSLILSVGVVLIVIIATNWRPASSAPGLWIPCAIGTVALGFIVALTAATMLSKREYAKTRSERH